jgi:transposase InsO family protein
VGSASYLVRAVVFEKRSVREVAATHGVSKTWLYELVSRYRGGGDEALVPKSRRPLTSPTRIDQELEDEIVRLRKSLADDGFDAGAVTIQTHLVRRHGTVPAVSSIWRVLNRRGFVTPQPQKRPKSSYIRFEAELPNERWQMDMTHVEIEADRHLEVLNVIDDHSRLCVASTAFPVVNATDVVSVFTEAAQRYGLPASVLTDNGAIFTAAYRNGRCLTETVLESFGVAMHHSRPYHPQTCGKVERFHQTEKKFLAKQDPATSVRELQGQLDRFVNYYNDVRPHRAKGRRTPRAAFEAKIKAAPLAAPTLPFSHYRVRNDKVDKVGKITVRYEGRLRHISVGRAHCRERVLVLVADRDVRVLSPEGELLSHVVIDPERIYQPKLKAIVSGKS